MKKIAFAAQVFSLIALLPVLVILEMNHTVKDPSEKELPAGIVGAKEITLRSPLKLNEKMVNEAFNMPLGTFLIKDTF